ncbi:putative HTH-type transcriptional regulator YusO [Bacillus paralicheniformis]|nr:putative HTH-type transcriptional regulator YusO [Bacillus paralicheniformis]
MTHVKIHKIVFCGAFAYDKIDLCLFVQHKIADLLHDVGNEETFMNHHRIEANLLDHAFTKYLRSSKKLDEETIPKSITSGKRFILRIIYRHGTCTIKEILQEVALSPSATTTALNHLEKEGFVIRSRNNDDRRTVWIELSQEGTRIAAQMVENRQALIDKLFGKLSEEEKKVFFAIIEKIMM